MPSTKEKKGLIFSQQISFHSLVLENRNKGGIRCHVTEVLFAGSADVKI